MKKIKEKQQKSKTIKSIRNHFRLEKENKAIKDIIFSEIRNLFGQKKEDYHKPARVENFWSRNCIEYKTNADRNKTLSIEEYLNKTRLYLKNILKLLLKIQQTIAMDFIV